MIGLSADLLTGEIAIITTKMEWTLLLIVIYSGELFLRLIQSTYDEISVEAARTRMESTSSTSMTPMFLSPRPLLVLLELSMSVITNLASAVSLLKLIVETDNPNVILHDEKKTEQVNARSQL